MLGILRSHGVFNETSRYEKFHLLAEAALISYADRSRWIQSDFTSAGKAKDLVSTSSLSRLSREYTEDQHRLPKGVSRMHGAIHVVTRAACPSPRPPRPLGAA